MLHDMIRNGFADCDIEYRITEVEVVIIHSILELSFLVLDS